MCRYSLVGTATGNWLDDRMIEVRFPAGARNFLFDTMSRLALEITQPPIQRVPGDLFLGIKRSGREADHSPQYSDEVKECVYRYKGISKSFRTDRLERELQMV
jgi:hypothetical protein